MTRYFIGLSLLLFLACQNSEPDPQLKLAFEVHDAALQTYDSLKSELTSLQAQPLTPEDQQKVAELQEAGNKWEENMVEVPGFEHADGHAHDHNHDHSHSHNHASDDLKDLPPAEMLELQQALGQEVKRLLSETRQLAVKVAPPIE